MADYIKKQDVIEYLNEECEVGCVDPFTDHYRRECFREAVECIESIETVEAEPVRHGKWVVNKWGDLVCSECNWNAPLIEIGSFTTRRQEYDRSRYCWHCGAKMDGEGE